MRGMLVFILFFMFYTQYMLIVENTGKRNDENRNHLYSHHSEMVTTTIFLFISNAEIS